MEKYQLKQQPERAMFLNGKNGGDCAYKAILNEHLNPSLDIQYGIMLVWDKNLNGFDSPFNFHLWNIDESTNTIYDGFDNLSNALDQLKFNYKPFDDWKIALVDGSNIKHKGDYHSFQIKPYNKTHKGYDAVYIYNFGFRHDKKTLLDWEYVDDQLNSIEEEMIDRDIFKKQLQTNELIVCI
jgi:hypothetical protein